MRWAIKRLRRGTSAKPVQMNSWNPVAATKLSAPLVANFTHDLKNQINNQTWSRDTRCVVDRVRTHPRVHALSHEALGLGDEHVILLGQQIPARHILPKRTSYGNADTCRRNRALNSGQYRQLLRRCVLRKGRGKRLLWQPDQPVTIRSELWRCGVRLVSIEHLGYRFSLGRGKRGDVDQRLDPGIACGADDRASVGVSDQHNGSFNPFQGSVKCRNVVVQGR